MGGIPEVGTLCRSDLGPERGAGELRAGGIGGDQGLRRAREGRVCIAMREAGHQMELGLQPHLPMLCLLTSHFLPTTHSEPLLKPAHLPMLWHGTCSPPYAVARRLLTCPAVMRTVASMPVAVIALSKPSTTDALVSSATRQREAFEGCEQKSGYPHFQQLPLPPSLNQPHLPNPLLNPSRSANLDGSGC